MIICIHSLIQLCLVNLLTYIRLTIRHLNVKINLIHDEMMTLYISKCFNRLSSCKDNIKRCQEYLHHLKLAGYPFLNRGEVGLFRHLGLNWPKKS